MVREAWVADTVGLCHTLSGAVNIKCLQIVTLSDYLCDMPAKRGKRRPPPKTRKEIERTTARLSISLPQELREAVEAQAAKERRNLSNYVALILEEVIAEAQEEADGQ